jgi:argininosuccinate lyase
LPLAYNRDLQEDKEPLFDSIDQVSLALGALAGMIATAHFDLARMKAAADAPTSAATDLAEWLVARGTPFREAHAIVGEIVRMSLEPGGSSLLDLVDQSPHLGPDAVVLLAPGVAAKRRTSPGGGGPHPLAAQRAAFTQRLTTDRERVGGD